MLAYWLQRQHLFLQRERRAMIRCLTARETGFLVSLFAFTNVILLTLLGLLFVVALHYLRTVLFRSRHPKH